MKKARKRLDKELRKLAVLDALQGAQEPQTIADIANFCGISKSPFLRAVLKELLAEGRIVGERVILWNGVTGTGYLIRPAIIPED